MGEARTAPGAQDSPSLMTFALPDRHRRLARVRLAQEIGLPDAQFTRKAGRWQLAIENPGVDRMEYLFDLEDHNGHRWTITDPGNPLRAPGAFGDKSVLEFDGYERPHWLDADVAEGAYTEHDGAVVWSADGLADGEPAPLVLVHDGPEYDALGSFTRYLASLRRPVRAALLEPGERNERYSADPDYAEAAADLIPTLAPATVRIGVGVSLGALAMVHLQRSCPGLVDAMLLQSGSFFTVKLDPQERRFEYFAQVTEFVAGVQADGCPAVLTCGTVEENLANNERMANKLGAVLHRRRDAHNYTAWRDALHPWLGELIADAT